MMPGMRNILSKDSLLCASSSSNASTFFSSEIVVSIRFSIWSECYPSFFANMTNLSSKVPIVFIFLRFASFKTIRSPLPLSYVSVACSFSFLSSRSSFDSIMSNRLLSTFSIFVTLSSIKNTFLCATSALPSVFSAMVYVKFIKPWIVSRTGVGILCHKSGLIKFCTSSISTDTSTAELDFFER